ncbi:hypothetical protein [Hymenobacter mucosus]|uniref:Uncharacterized protein n=1 Tax=Hymenobacter mucosus TaxID=1411120 RepID=A0A239A3F9_9BACT|nr:hypothetical protein [Hymenobacter mucosus]SNR89433.1 hypothetical protein SAMN06269173_110130 [Hymenobacter mucosus]
MNQSILSAAPVREPLAARCSRLLLRLRQASHRPTATPSFTPDYASFRPRAYRPYPPHLRGARHRRSYWRRTRRALGVAILIVLAISMVTLACGHLLSV